MNLQKKCCFAEDNATDGTHVIIVANQVPHYIDDLGNWDLANKRIVTMGTGISTRLPSHEAKLPTDINCHRFRGPDIHLKNGCIIEYGARIAGGCRTGTTQRSK